MNAKADVHSPLVPQRAFVVQFRAETELERGVVSGRVEHVVSGQAVQFSALEELLAFMAHVLVSAGVQSSGCSTDDS